MAATWPLTGRAEELSLIGELLHSRNGPLGVVLAGAAGVGRPGSLGRPWRWLSSAARVPGARRPDAVTVLWKDGHLTRLELQPLSKDETAALVEARLDGPLDSAAARRLWSVTQGNTNSGRITGAVRES